MTLVLYNSAISGNCYKVRLLLAHLGREVELRELSVTDRSNRPDVLGGLNPSLRVPTLILEDGRPLGESGAILWYLGEGTRFVPADAYERARVLQWMFFEQYDHEPAIAVARFLVHYAGLEPAEYEKRLPRLIEAGDKALGAMESHLAGRRWLVGETITLADIALYGYTHVADEAGLDLVRYPAIGAWLARVAAEPGHVPIDG
jgi:glutathione S-transferase